MRFGFVGPNYQSPTPLADAEQLINWRVQKIEPPNARVAFALLPTSGLQLFANLSAAAGIALPSVRGSYTVSGRVFFVAGTHLFEVLAGGAVTDYGGAGTLNNNIVDDGLPATMTSAGTVGSVQLGIAQNITAAIVSSPTTAQITVGTNLGFTPNAKVVIAGITDPNFTQLNGTWVVAGLSGTTLVNLTTSGLLVNDMQAISNATISSAIAAQVTVPSNLLFTVGAYAVITGITHPNFLQLNGAWIVASLSGSTLVNLTTVGLTIESATALTAGTAIPTVTEAAGTATPSSTSAGGYPSQLLIASGGNLTVFSLLSDTYQAIGTPPTQVLMVDFLDGFFVALSAGNVWSVSNPEDATSWPGISVSQVSVFSDQLTGIIASNRLLWVFGAKRAVGYYNSGAALFPFDVASGAFMEVGLAAQYSLARVATHSGTTIMWLGGDERGQGVVYAANGFIPQRVSDSALEYWMSQQTTIADAVGMARQEEGQNFYDLWFPTANAFWTLDVDLGFWHRRTSLVKGAQAAHLSRTHVVAFGFHLVGDRTSGNVYRMSTNFFTDNGAAIIRTRVGPTISLEGGQLTVPINEFQVDFEVGMGPQPPLKDNFGNPRDPVAMFSYSEDFGKTFGAERMIACGQAGNFKAVAVDRRLGSWRNWTPKVTVSDPIPWRIADAYVNNTEDQQDRLAKTYAKIT